MSELRCTVNKIHCAHNTSGACNFGEICHPIVESCQGCGRVLTNIDPAGEYCGSYPLPEAQWRRGTCPLASHVKLGVEQAVKLNPLKASKRARRRR